MFKLRLAKIWTPADPKPAALAPEKPASAPASDSAPAQKSSTPNCMLVERGGELEKLKQLWHEAEAGAGRVVLIAGEAGHGKTALADQLITELQAEGRPFKVARAACSAQSGQDEAFWPFADALSQVIAAPTKKITEDVLDAFLEFAPSWAEVIPVAGQVVGASLKTAQIVRNRTKTTDSPNPDKLLREYAGALKKAADKAPVLMFIDDLHWSDAASIKLLSHLARTVRAMRVLLIGAYRPSDIAVEEHLLSESVAEIMRYDNDAQMMLLPLTEQGIRQLVDKLYPGNKFGDRLTPYLTTSTSGAPLFVVESLRLMQARGEIAKDASDGRWALLRDLNESDLPHNVEAIINKRLERLPEDLQEVLALAAVQGTQFDAAVLAYVLDKNEIEIMKLLEPAEYTHGIIEFAGDVDLGEDVTVRYRFSSNLFQRELLAQLRGKQRLLAYRKTAEGLDHLWPDDSEDIAPKLANLYEQGKVFDASARFRITAGHYARQAGDITRAIKLYEDAERSLEKVRIDNPEESVLVDKQRQQINEALSYLYEVDSSYDKCEIRTRRALAQGLETLGWRRYASLRMRLAALSLRAGRFNDALNILLTLQASLEATQPEEANSYEAFQLRAEIAKVEALLGRADNAQRTAEDGMQALDAMADQSWHKAARARLTTALSMAYHENGEYRKAIKLSEETLHALNDLNMISTYAALLSTLVQLYVEVGDYEKARHCIGMMKAAAAETSNESLLASAHLAAGLIKVLTLKPQDALDELAIADKYAQQVRLFEDRPRIMMLQAFSRIDLRRLDEAKATLDELIPMTQESGLAEWEAYAHLAQARYTLAMGDPQTALELAQSAAKVFEAEGTRFDQAIALRILARAHLALGQRDTGCAGFERAALLFRLIGNTEMYAVLTNELANLQPHLQPQ
jgi:RecA/RadA recombinase